MSNQSNKSTARAGSMAWGHDGGTHGLVLASDLTLTVAEADGGA